ncbi:MAG: Ni/Fe hydrogenase subunit alpha [Planctomycetes bacterium]|nr:Ni/Fe hydrogenase subunit alpha [Planctomycetota bacterium]
MAQTITIEPVTKIEGHAKVTIHLDDSGNVADARFHVTEFRGFEKFCEGRMLWDMPVITERACGICPVSHHLASAKACDAVLGAEIPPAAHKLRELMHLCQIINSHALHFFFLAGPDLLIGPDADPIQRSVMGLLEADPELAKKAIRLRQIAQTGIERIGGRKIHPVTAIPGGMSRPLSHEDRFVMLQEADEAIELCKLAIDTAKRLNETYVDIIRTFAALDTCYVGLVKDGALELYDGDVRVVDPNGQKLAEFNGADYLKYIGERVEDWSYLKFPFFKGLGWPDGVYRVNGLARLNVADRISTPLANEEHKIFKQLGNGRPVRESLYFHYARTIEMLYAAERMKELLEDDEIVSREVRVPVARRAGEGVGVLEAPRGTLFHHYWADDMGKVTRVNLIVATVQNNPAMDMSVKQVAKQFIRGGEVREGLLNRVEMAIRCYDPCLSCATHAVGQMPLVLQLFSTNGDLVQEFRRG